LFSTEFDGNAFTRKPPAVDFLATTGFVGPVIVETGISLVGFVSSSGKWSVDLAVCLMTIEDGIPLLITLWTGGVT
jgi:hypothetical protein